MNDNANDLHYTALELAEIKSVAVLNTDENKSAETDTTAERTIVFVASDNSEDRAHEHVEISTFYLPTKNGGLVRVADLAESKNTAVDIPLLTDHNGWEVDKVIGSVRSANFENGKLVFTVGISKRKYAQDLMTLIDEGHLHNAFSIGWRSGAYAPDTKTYTDGEILEVSLVTRGCNRDAFVLDIKSTNPNSRNAPPNPPDTPNEENEKSRFREKKKLVYSSEESQTFLTTKLAEQTNQALSNQGEKTMQDEEIKNTETTTPATEAPTPESAPEATNNESPQTKGTPMNETTNQKQIAAAQVQTPTQKITVTSNAKAYLATEEANADFAKFIAENYGKSNTAVIKAWAEKMAEKGITGDEILPSQLEQTFFKVWTSDRGILAHMKSAKLLQGNVYGYYATGRGAGHKKGEKKDNVGFETVRRDYKAKIAFAKMPIDLQDLIDDTTGELTILRGELLADLLYNEIVRAIIVSDGRGEPSEGEKDLRMFDGTRGLWSMLGDINKSATSGTDSATKFAKAVATKITNTAGDNAYDKAVKTLSALKGRSEKILVAPEGFISGLMLEKDNDGRYVFAPGSNFAQLLTAKIFEFDFMTDCGMDLIGFNDGKYLFPNGRDMLRSAFDNDYNQDVLLHEKPVAGSLFGRKVCAGYASASTTDGNKNDESGDGE